MENKYVYFAEVERFGYTLQTLALTEEKAKDTMIKTYVDIFKAQNNGLDPKNEINNDRDKSWYDAFLEDLCIEKRELNKVIWI